MRPYLRIVDMVPLPYHISDHVAEMLSMRITQSAFPPFAFKSEGRYLAWIINGAATYRFQLDGITLWMLDRRRKELVLLAAPWI